VSIEFRVPENKNGDRLDRLVARHAGVSRRQARLWIAQGRVRVRGRVLKIMSRGVGAGAHVTVDANTGQAEATARVRPDPDLLHLDRWIVAVNKPAGLLSETGREAGPSLETEVPALLAKRGERGTRVQLVHRLDAGTSGVILLARRPRATRELNRAFAAGHVRKTYLALCAGVVTAQRIDAPLGRIHGVRQGVLPGGRPAVTEVETVTASERFSLVRARPETGRTHQIRVHLAHVGFPLLGDPLYGGLRYDESVPPEPIGRVMLHAARLELDHPETGNRLELSCEPPSDFVELARRLGVWPDGGLH
jgi:23S rRNA pseudouridine1911/1915/1917 synthase